MPLFTFQTISKSTNWEEGDFDGLEIDTCNLNILEQKMNFLPYQKIEITFFPFCFQKPDYIYTLNCNKNFDTKCYIHGHLLTYGY